MPFLLLATGCAQFNAAGSPNYQQIDQGAIDRAIEQATFRYPECAKDIRLGRVSSDSRHIELAICGTVRRYDDISPVLHGANFWVDPTWVDVTAATAR